MPESVIVEPKYDSPPLGDLILQIATVADDIAAWGHYPAERDRQLRAFWPTEPILASAIYSTASRYASFGWTLTGPQHTKTIVQKVFHSCDFGAGWTHFILKVIIDLFTQDNGAFIEIVRAGDSPTSPVLSMNHLDSGKCIRTGRRETPVKYVDENGGVHALKWYQVLTLEECPSPLTSARGMQYCAVTRLLRAAQIMRDLSIYEREKISGRFNRAIHLVGGIQKKTVTDALTLQSTNADNSGLVRYIQPLIIASLDPTATVSHELIELASLPDGFDKEQAMRWYVNQLALAFGSDYQDFAPLPAGNVGSSQQSDTLDRKSRGKGPRLFMSIIEQKFNFHGIMPSTTSFAYGEQDLNEELTQAKLRLLRAQELQTRIAAGIITTEVARQISVDSGDLPVHYLEMMREDDFTPVSETSGNKPVIKEPDVEVPEGIPGPKEPPASAISAPFGKPISPNINGQQGAGAGTQKKPNAVAGKI